MWTEQKNMIGLYSTFSCMIYCQFGDYICNFCFSDMLLSGQKVRYRPFSKILQRKEYVPIDFLQPIFDLQKGLHFGRLILVLSNYQNTQNSRKITKINERSQKFYQLKQLLKSQRRIFLENNVNILLSIFSRNIYLRLVYFEFASSQFT